MSGKTLLCGFLFKLNTAEQIVAAKLGLQVISKREKPFKSQTGVCMYLFSRLCTAQYRLKQELSSSAYPLLVSIPHPMTCQWFSFHCQWVFYILLVVDLVSYFRYPVRSSVHIKLREILEFVDATFCLMKTNPQFIIQRDDLLIGLNHQNSTLIFPRSKRNSKPHNNEREMLWRKN